MALSSHRRRALTGAGHPAAPSVRPVRTGRTLVRRTVLDEEPIDFFGGQKLYAFWEEVLKDIPDVYFGRGWVEARAILTSGIEPIMRGDVSVADGLKTAADSIRSQLGKS